MKQKVNKRQQSKEKTSRAILKASIEEFAKYGYINATFTRISSVAKVTKGLIVQRFGSKELLFVQIFNDILIKDFPNLNDFNEVDDALVKIIEFIKKIGKRSKFETSFALTALNNFAILPKQCVKEIWNVYKGTRLDRIFDLQIASDEIKARSGFDSFINFLVKCLDLTLDSF